MTPRSYHLVHRELEWQPEALHGDERPQRDRQDELTSDPSKGEQHRHDDNGNHEQPERRRRLLPLPEDARLRGHPRRHHPGDRPGADRQTSGPDPMSLPTERHRPDERADEAHGDHDERGHGRIGVREAHGGHCFEKENRMLLAH